MLYEVTHHKQPPPRCWLARGRGTPGERGKERAGKHGAPRAGAPPTHGHASRARRRGKQVQYTATHHKQPPLLAGSRQGLSACRVQSMDVGCGCDAGHTTHTHRKHKGRRSRRLVAAHVGGAPASPCLGGTKRGISDVRTPSTARRRQARHVGGGGHARGAGQHTVGVPRRTFLEILVARGR